VSLTVSKALREALASRPVLHQGQADDCVIDTSESPGTPIRVWVPRDPGDSVTIMVEVCRQGKWLEAHDEAEGRVWLHEALATVAIDDWSTW